MMGIPTKTKQLLLCAATRWEYAALSGLKNAHIVLLQTGMGPQETARALPKDAPFDRVISSGLAGALQEGMRSGDIVADLRGSEVELVQAAREIAQRQGLALHLGPIAHSDTVLENYAQKSAFSMPRRACAVDMETEAIRAWGQERGTPVLAVRAILDGLHDRLPAPPYWRDLPLGLLTGLKMRRAMRNLRGFLEEFLGQI